MNKQRFTIEERFSFWEGYDKKCIYCNLPIFEISNLEIDHLLPESLISNPDKLKETLKTYDLPDSYKLTDYYNLVSSCASCNRNKGKNIDLIVNSINLSIASRKATLVANLVEKYRKKFTANLESQITTVPFQYLFRDRLVKGPIDKSKLMDLYDFPVHLGSITDFTLSGGRESPSAVIETVNEYNACLANGYNAASTFEMHMSWNFEQAKIFLRIIETAKLPKISYFSDQGFLFIDLDQISATVAERPSCTSYPIDSFDPNMSLHELSTAESQLIKSIECNNESFSVYFHDSCEDIFGPRFLSYQEIVRADITGQGYEEILCSYYSATGGSLRYWGLALLQKCGPTDLIICGSLKV